MAKALRPPVAQPDAMIDLHFPMAGIDLSTAFDQQPNRPLPADGNYARTTAIGRNVRAYEPRTGRSRGGARAGLERHIDEIVASTGVLLLEDGVSHFLLEDDSGVLAFEAAPYVFIQHLNLVVGSGFTPPGGIVQTSQSGRVVILVSVAGGTVKVATAGAASWSDVTNGAAALNTTGVIYSSALDQKLYFVDGTNAKYYDPADNTVHDWIASAGDLPQDDDLNRPRLICTWQGRIVLSGLLGDPQNVFASAIDDATNFDYNPLAPSAAQAFVFGGGTFGLIGDNVTALMPYTDDVLVIGTDHQIWTVQGNPADGGQLYKVSDGIGAAWGTSWCVDPLGQIYFISNTTGIYRLTPTQSSPTRISQGIEQLLQAINTGSTTVSLNWDDRWQGLHVFVTSTAGPSLNDVHFFYEARTNAWWTDSFGDANFNPLVSCTFQGNRVEDRVVLIGSWDGYVRFLSKTAQDDDGTPIDSEVLIGPLNTKDLDDIMYKDVQGILAEGGGPVTVGIMVGRTAEAALASNPVVTGTWNPSRNLTRMVNRSGHALYTKIDASNPWAMEAIRCRIQGLGRVRARGK